MASDPAAAPLRPVGEPEQSETGSKLDAWLIWLIAVVAIALPALVLLIVSSISAYRFDLHDVKVATGRGEFLVPILIMCAESIRKWTREVTGGRVIGALRVIACVVCSVVGVSCFTAVVQAAVLSPTPAISRSLTIGTLIALLAAAISGTTAVILGRGR